MEYLEALEDPYQVEGLLEYLALVQEPLRVFFLAQDQWVYLYRASLQYQAEEDFSVGVFWLLLSWGERHCWGRKPSRMAPGCMDQAGLLK